MKNRIALFLVLMLCLTFSAAFAEGFSGLGGGGFGDLITDTAKALPDPYEALDSYGTLIRTDYLFADDYICNVYTYPTPLGVSAFIEKYARQCSKAGYSVSETIADGVSGYMIRSGSDKYALLMPDVGGEMMLLVQKGMEFDYQKPTNYASIIYNDRSYDMELWYSDEASFLGTMQWSMVFKGDRMPFSNITIYVPQTIRTGDVLYSDDDTNTKGFALTLNSGNIYLLSSGGVSDRIFDSGEYCKLQLTNVEDVKDGVLIEGVLEGNFYGDICIEDFVFSAIVQL